MSGSDRLDAIPDGLVPPDDDFADPALQKIHGNMRSQGFAMAACQRQVLVEIRHINENIETATQLQYQEHTLRKAEIDGAKELAEKAQASADKANKTLHAAKWLIRGMWLVMAGIVAAIWKRITELF